MKLWSNGCMRSCRCVVPLSSLPASRCLSLQQGGSQPLLSRELYFARRRRIGKFVHASCLSDRLKLDKPQPKREAPPLHMSPLSPVISSFGLQGGEPNEAVCNTSFVSPQEAFPSQVLHKMEEHRLESGEVNPVEGERHNMEKDEKSEECTLMTVPPSVRGSPDAAPPPRARRGCTTWENTSFHVTELTLTLEALENSLFSVKENELEEREQELPIIAQSLPQTAPIEPEATILPSHPSMQSVVKKNESVFSSDGSPVEFFLSVPKLKKRTKVEKVSDEEKQAARKNVQHAMQARALFSLLDSASLGQNDEIENFESIPFTHFVISLDHVNGGVLIHARVGTKDEAASLRDVTDSFAELHYILRTLQNYQEKKKSSKYLLVPTGNSQRLSVGFSLHPRITTFCTSEAVVVLTFLNSDLSCLYASSVQERMHWLSAKERLFSGMGDLVLLQFHLCACDRSGSLATLSSIPPLFGVLDFDAELALQCSSTNSAHTPATSDALSSVLHSLLQSLPLPPDSDVSITFGFPSLREGVLLPAPTTLRVLPKVLRALPWTVQFSLLLQRAPLPVSSGTPQRNWSWKDLLLLRSTVLTPLYRAWSELYRVFHAMQWSDAQSVGLSALPHLHQYLRWSQRAANWKADARDGFQRMFGGSRSSLCLDAGLDTSLLSSSHFPFRRLEPYITAALVNEAKKAIHTSVNEQPCEPQRVGLTAVARSAVHEFWLGDLPSHPSYAFMDQRGRTLRGIDGARLWHHAFEPVLWSESAFQQWYRADPFDGLSPVTRGSHPSWSPSAFEVFVASPDWFHLPSEAQTKVLDDFQARYSAPLGSANVKASRRLIVYVQRRVKTTHIAAFVSQLRRRHVILDGGDGALLLVEDEAAHPAGPSNENCVPSPRVRREAYLSVSPYTILVRVNDTSEPSPPLKTWNEGEILSRRLVAPLREVCLPFPVRNDAAVPASWKRSEQQLREFHQRAYAAVQHVLGTAFVTGPVAVPYVFTHPFKIASLLNNSSLLGVVDALRVAVSQLYIGMAERGVHGGEGGLKHAFASQLCMTKPLAGHMSVESSLLRSSSSSSLGRVNEALVRYLEPYMWAVCEGKHLLSAVLPSWNALVGHEDFAGLVAVLALVDFSASLLLDAGALCCAEDINLLSMHALNMDPVGSGGGLLALAAHWPSSIAAQDSASCISTLPCYHRASQVMQVILAQHAEQTQGKPMDVSSRAGLRLLSLLMEKE